MLCAEKKNTEFKKYETELKRKKYENTKISAAYYVNIYLCKYNKESNLTIKNPSSKLMEEGNRPNFRKICLGLEAYTELCQYLQRKFWRK